MTIEEALARQALNLGRIADALEAIAANQGIVSEPTAPAKKKAAKKKTSKKAAAKNKGEVTVGKQVDIDDEVEWTLPMVRAELHKLQEQENQAAVKSVLKKFGGSTLKQIKDNKYGDLVAHVATLLDE